MDKKAPKTKVKKSKVKPSLPPSAEEDTEQENITDSHLQPADPLNISSSMGSGSAPATVHAHTSTGAAYVAPPPIGDSSKKIKKAKVSKTKKGKKVPPTAENANNNDTSVNDNRNISVDSSRSETKQFSSVPIPNFNAMTTSDLHPVDPSSSRRNINNNSETSFSHIQSLSECFTLMRTLLNKQENVFNEYDEYKRKCKTTTNNTNTNNNEEIFYTPRSGTAGRSVNNMSGMCYYSDSPESISLSPFSRPLSVVPGSSINDIYNTPGCGTYNNANNVKVSPITPGSLSLSIPQGNRYGEESDFRGLHLNFVQGNDSTTSTSKYGNAVPPPPLSVESLTSSRTTSLATNTNSNSNYNPSSASQLQPNPTQRGSITTTVTSTRNNSLTEFSPPSTVSMNPNNNNNNNNNQTGMMSEYYPPAAYAMSPVDVLVSPITPHPNSRHNSVTNLSTNNNNNSQEDRPNHSRTLQYNAEEEEEEPSPNVRAPPTEEEAENKAEEEEAENKAEGEEEENTNTNRIKKPSSLRVVRRPPMVPAGPTPPPPGASSSLLSLQTQSNASEGEEEKKEKEEEDKWSFEREHELRFLPPELRGEGGAAPTSADPSPGQEEEEMEDLPEEEGEENETSINNYYEFSKYIFQNIPRATDLPKVKSQRTRRGCRRIRGGNHNSSSHSDPNTTVGGIASDTDLMERMEELLVYKEENRELMRSAERGMERSTSPDHTNPQEELDELKEAFNNSGVRRGRRGMRRAASEHNRPHNEGDNHTTAKEEEEAAKAADSPPGQPVEGTLSSQSPINHGMDTSAPSPVTLPMEESAPTPPEAGGTSPLEASHEGAEPPAVDNASVTSTATTGSANSLQYYTFCQEEEMTKAKTDETGKKKKSKKRKSSKVESTDVPALGLPTTKSKTSRYVIKHTPRGSTGGRRISAPVVEGKLGNIHYNNKAKEQTEFMATVMQALAERNPTAGGDLHIEGKQLPLARRDTFPKNKRRKTFSSFNTSAAANNNNNNTTVERPRRVTLPPTQTSHPNSPDDTITAESPLISSSFLTVHQNLTERKERYKMMEEIYVNNNNTSNSPVHAAGFTVEATPPGLDSLSPNRNHNNNSNTNLLSPQNEVEAVGSGSLVGINSNPNNTAGASEPTSEGASPANPVYLPPPAVSPSNTRRKVVLQTRVTPKISATPSNNNNKEADATNNSNAGTPTRRRGKEANNNSNSPPAQHVSLQTNNNNNTTTNATSSNNNSNTNSAVRRRASLGEGNILSLPKRQ